MDNFIQGAYAEYIALSSKMIIHKPASLSTVESAGVPENWMTAYQALFLEGNFKKGDRVLIHAGASGVGGAAIQLAREWSLSSRTIQFVCLSSLSS